MRILFRSARECDEYRATMIRIHKWWAAFQNQTGRLDSLFSKQVFWDLPGWMDEFLHAIDPRLCWEFGPCAPGHRLVITPENEKHLRPLVDLILREAPRLQGWQFYGHRQPESIEAAAASVAARTQGCMDDLQALVREGPLNTVALRLVSPRYLEDDEPGAFEEAFVAMESLLGEEVLDRWIGPISTGPVDPSRRTLALERVRPTVEALIGRLREQMPRSSCARRLQGDAWGTYSFRKCAKLRQAIDFVGRDDLLVGETMYWDMIQAGTNGGAFSSDRFSNAGETFCYVKIDGSEGFAGSTWANRGEAGAALNRALLAAGAGACIGGGTGIRYRYIDLALTDLRDGCRIARDVLRAGRLPKRSWILFHDATLKAEWIGIYDETPPPLLAVK